MNYKTKSFNFGFVILSPEPNFGRLKSTVRSCNRHHKDAPVVCVVAKTTLAADVKEMKTICPTFKGGETITSLINTGIKKGHKEWNMLLMEGVFMRREVVNRYSRFMDGENDIMYPIIMDYDRDMRPTKIYSSFTDCSLNGILIHQKTFKNVGNFSDNPMEVSRKMWAMEAAGKGVNFKGVLGNKIC